MTQGRSEPGGDRLRRAIAARPYDAAAHHVLGRVLTDLGDLDAAEASLRRAWSLAPESEEILVSLAMFLVGHRNSPEALQLLAPWVEGRPSWTIKTAFANCVSRAVFVVDDPRMRRALTAAITEPWTFPNVLRTPALSLILLDARVAACVRLVNERWPARPPKADLFGPAGLSALAGDSLLHALLQAAPVDTIEFERFLTAARRVLLETALGQPPDPADTAGLRFYAALARQCFINEYIFDSCDDERVTAAGCRTRLLALLDAGATLPPLLVLAVAAYFPLYTLPEPSRLLSASLPGPVDEVLRQQVREPLQEQALRARVSRLTPIARGVSEAVRDQYEKNPYPRWVRLPRHDLAQRFNEDLRRALPLAQFAPLADDSGPEMLIAGCGTGSHSIFAALKYRGVRVLAVDLSVSSICYALRKTLELGITNVEYAQADILQLGDIGRTFDIIASVGVLHHLADPFLGWRTLLSVLRPGGFMQLGLYSQRGRRRLERARELIAARGYASTVDDIRRFRHAVAAADAGDELRWLSGFPDFYSTSECRDVAFHIQEHCLTIDQIEAFVGENGLHFVGFEVRPAVLLQYRRCFSADPTASSLHNWARFEADYPDTFAEMYRFWIQKPGR